MVTAPRPAAIGYVSGPEDVTARQREAIAVHALAEWFALAVVLTDPVDGFTISQILDSVYYHDAKLVILPAGTSLAAAPERLECALAELGATCVVIDALPVRGATAQPGSTPRHPARKSQ